MKLNFWQWIGIGIVAIALIVIIRREVAKHGGGPNRALDPVPESSPQRAVEVPSTQAAPTTAPAAP